MPGPNIKWAQVSDSSVVTQGANPARRGWAEVGMDLVRPVVLTPPEEDGLRSGWTWSDPWASLNLPSRTPIEIIYAVEFR